MKVLKTIFLASAFLWITENYAQSNTLRWISFEQLEDSLQRNPKKTLIFFTTSWCAYCKKMERTTFKDPSVVSVLNKEYYVVKMDAESNDTIQFDGSIYYNKEIGKKRKPIHELAVLLGSRKEHYFSVPLTIILDKNFAIKERHFEFVSTERMKQILEK